MEEHFEKHYKVERTYTCFEEGDNCKGHLDASCNCCLRTWPCDTYRAYLAGWEDGTGTIGPVSARVPVQQRRTLPAGRVEGPDAVEVA